MFDRSTYICISTVTQCLDVEGFFINLIDDDAYASFHFYSYCYCYERLLYKIGQSMVNIYAYELIRVNSISIYEFIYEPMQRGEWYIVFYSQFMQKKKKNTKLITLHYL